MKSRKGELLELLRRQRDNGSSGSASRATTASPSPQRTAHVARTRFYALFGAVLLVPLAALALGFFAPPEAGLSASTGPGTSELPKESLIVPSKKNGSPTPAPSTGNAPAGVPQAEFGVQVITYKHNPRNLELARAVGRFLMEQGLPQVLPLQVTDGDESFIEIYVGSANTALELARLQGKLQTMQYPEGSGRKPFASAFTAPIPSRIQ